MRVQCCAQGTWRMRRLEVRMQTAGACMLHACSMHLNAVHRGAWCMHLHAMRMAIE